MHRHPSQSEPAPITATLPTLMSLPAELHLSISTHLSYPDALALRHNCRRFYNLVDTGVLKKVDWLTERFQRNLEVPMEKCSLRTDEDFCNWRIRRTMARRRRHLECWREEGGCIIIEGSTCQLVLAPAWLKRHSTLKYCGDEGEHPFQHLVHMAASM